MTLDAPFAQVYDLLPADEAQLRRVAVALPITADVSRADLLLYGRASDGRVLVIRHVIPRSISSHYPTEITGKVLPATEQPLVDHALHSGRGGQRQIEVVSSGAPVLQDVYPILNPAGQAIAALVVETNMIAHERQRRRDPSFRQAVEWLLAMCMRGELPGAESLSRFGLYDGIYVADRSRMITYMSGIAANLYRSIGLAVDMEGQLVTELEPQDDALVDEALRTGICCEQRHETADGRVWVRKALPLQKSPTWRLLRLRAPRWSVFRPQARASVDGVLVLLHNATDAVAKQRELNVKSAIIQEVHHRVKNNLQAIASFLRMQARRVQGEEARQELSVAVNRILSMAVIHEYLSEDEYQPINIRDLCQRIAYQVREVTSDPEQEIMIEVTGPSIRLPAGQATPVAMVVNELLLNALEHGLAGHRRGRITIELQEEGNCVQLTIRNSGSRLPPDFDPGQSRSLGLHIVQTLVRDDLKGVLTITPTDMPTVTSPDSPVSSNSPASPAGGEIADAAAVEDDFQHTQARITFPKRSLKVD
jgi:two-component sensor histidine kinase